MKILIVSQYFYPENFRINDFAFSLCSRGHEVTVLTGLPNYPKGKLFGDFEMLKTQRVNGIKIIRVPLLPRFSSKGWQLFLNYLSFLLSSLIFAPFLLRSKNFDVVFTPNYSPATVGITGVILSKWKNTKMVLWIQDFWPESLQATGAINSEYILKIIGSMVRWIYKGSDLILLQSKAFKKPLLKLNIQKDKLIYFPNWAEDLYSKQNLKKNSLLSEIMPKDKFIVMFAGNLGKAQSLDTILKAADITKDSKVHWVILGDGRDRKRFEEDVSKLQLKNISLLGSYPVEQMPSFFNYADALIVTLKSDPIFAATIPGKIQSYMLSGKPIIASLDGEGAKVIDESGCGMSVQAEDFEGLANSVFKMSIKSKKEREIMGQKAKEFYYDNFDREMLVDKFEKMINTKIK